MSFISKTAAFSGLSALRHLVSDSIAIDMGSTATIVFVHGRGVVVDEPSLVAVNKITGEAIAFGDEAHEMYGRETRDVQVIAPMVHGVVADYERTAAMLGHFIRKARSGISYFSRRALMSVLSGITQVEQRAFLNAAEKARIGRVCMIEEGLAAALGAGVRIRDPHASVVLDIGGATTNIAIIANGSVVQSLSQRIGGSDINAAIKDHLRRHRGLSIGEPTAERVKIELASATLPSDLDRTMTVVGADVVTGTPGAIEINAGEIYPVAQFMIRKLLALVTGTLTELTPEIAGDIYERGIILTGGGAQFAGLDDSLREATKLPIRIADEPRYATVRGLEEMFNEPLRLRRLLRSERHALLDSGGGSLNFYR